MAAVGARCYRKPSESRVVSKYMYIVVMEGVKFQKLTPEFDLVHIRHHLRGKVLQLESETPTSLPSDIIELIVGLDFDFPCSYDPP